MKNKAGQIIYIGKAKRLKFRVVSYFRQNKAHNQKVLQMVSQVEDFDYILCDSEFEALVLECSLIKQHSPKYNILLKDDKGYCYICITQEEYPRVKWVVPEKGGRQPVHRPLHQRLCGEGVGGDGEQAVRPAHLQSEIPGRLRQAAALSEFPHPHLCRGMHRQNEKGGLPPPGGAGSGLSHPRQQQLPKAAHPADGGGGGEAGFRNRRQAAGPTADDTAAGPEPKGAVGPRQGAGFHRRAGHRDYCPGGGSEVPGGILTDKESFTFPGSYEEKAVLEEFLPRYYHGGKEIPKVIGLPMEIEDHQLLEEYFTSLAGHKITLHQPQRGESRQILEMAQKNALEELTRLLNRNTGETVALQQLQKALGLSKLPDYIESYDISNLGDSSMVAGMVVFEHGRPKRSHYKKFTIKEHLAQDDYGCMSEVVSRRFAHFLNPEEKDEGFATKPDLILLDGGKGHVTPSVPCWLPWGWVTFRYTAW